VRFFADREYYARLFHYALPIAIQALVINSLAMVSVVMVGQLGETSVAAVALANQIFFLLNLVLFGVTTGSAMFTAQLWGRRDLPNIHKVLGLCLTLALVIGLAFLLIAELAPRWALGVYSRDPAVLALGVPYLRLFGWSFLFTALTSSYSVILRSVGNVRLPLYVSLASLSLNTVLSYGLIFGALGLPRLGIQGAAWATLTARVLEALALIWLSYRLKTAAAARLGELFRWDRSYVVRVLRPVLPVALNELLWSFGISAYSVVYARIGTESLAATNIAGTINDVALVLFLGIAHACAIMVGHAIGAGDPEEAQRIAGRSVAIGALGAMAMGGLILLASPSVLVLYKVAPIVIEYTRRVLLVVAGLLWLRVSNMILFIGVLRAGGDTRYGLVLDGIIIWIVGVPLAFAGGFLLHLPVYWVYLLVMSEEAAKCVLAVGRYFSRKWIHDLAQTV
jgi:putative MATE family efflux protein